MRILFLASVYYPNIMGGGEISTKLLAEGLAKVGHEVIVYSLGLKNVIKNINGVSVIQQYIPQISEEYMLRTKMESNSLKGLSKIYKFTHKYVDLVHNGRWYRHYKNLYQRYKPDLIHSVSALSYTGRYNAWQAAYDMKIPISHVSRSPDLVEFQIVGGRLNKIYQKLNARSAKYLTALAAPSKYMLQCHIEAGITAPYMEAIYNATECAEETNRIRGDFCKKENLILYAGDLREEKGILTLCKAVNGVSDTEVEFIGSGPLFNILKKQYKAPGWMGQDDLYQHMKKAKVFVLPSEWNEAFGRVLIEAIGNGTLAVGSDCGGIPEVLNFDEKYIFSAGNVEQLRTKIIRILHLNEDEYNRELSLQQKLLDKFTINRYITNWEEFFCKQLEKRTK